MNEAENILNMIENVSPDAIHALDEIDERVSAYYNQESAEYEKRMGYIPKEYTRSRDALKSIRPDSKRWWLDYLGYNTIEEGWDCAYDNGNITTEIHDSLPTEELAELHAIIQAIEWERNT